MFRRRTATLVAPLVGIVLLQALGALATPPPSFPWMPYLSWTGDPRTTVTISTLVPDRIDAFGAEVGPSPTALRPTAPATLTDVGQAFPQYRYTIEVQGLAPATTYYYRLGSPWAGWSELYHFTTAPASQASFTFLAVGDMGTKPNATATVRAMGNENFDFILHVGDLSYAGANQTNWSRWFALISPLAANHSYMVVPGNHENGSLQEKAMFRAYFAMPWSGSTDPYHTGPYYSFNYSTVHFVGLAVDTPHEAYPNATDWDPGQTRWLQRDLEAAANDSAHPWIVVYLHFPLFSSTTRANATSPTGSWMVGRETWGQLFDRYHVALVIAGHKHNYERTYPVWANATVADADRRDYYAPAAPIYVVTGGGGEKLQPVGPAQPWSAVRERTYEFLAITVSGGDLTVRTVASLTGATIDRFTLHRSRAPVTVVVPTTTDTHRPLGNTTSTVAPGVVIPATSMAAAGAAGLAVAAVAVVMRRRRSP